MRDPSADRAKRGGGGAVVVVVVVVVDVTLLAGALMKGEVCFGEREF